MWNHTVVVLWCLAYIFPDGSNDKESAFSAEDLGSTHELGRSPGEGNGNPLQYPCRETFRGQRSLASFKSVESQRVQHN